MSFRVPFQCKDFNDIKHIYFIMHICIKLVVLLLCKCDNLPRCYDCHYVVAIGLP